MTNDLIIKAGSRPSSYTIRLTGDFTDLPSALSGASLSPDKTAVIADTNTDHYYSEAVCERLSSVCGDIIKVTLEAGETAKNLDSVRMIYNALISHGFTRKSLLVSLGGGVIGDMTGFAAATYMRGIPFAQIPTTLLSQVDASVGGKTGFDYLGYKNMIGAFHMPSLVFINTETLRTLPEREYRGGLAEIIKAGLIKDAAFYEWLSENVSRIIAMDPDAVRPMIHRALTIKSEVVENDPFEKGERVLLNFGHTVGHAIEKASLFRLTHGECVSIGMAAAAKISEARGFLTEKERTSITDTLRLFGLPVTAEGLDPDEVIRNTHGDKKRHDGTVRFVLLDGIGRGVTSDDVTDRDMADALTGILL